MSALVGDGMGALLIGVSGNDLLKMEVRTGRIERMPLDVRDLSVFTFFR